ELMVAMVIQFILLAGMVYVYSNSRVMFTVNEQLSRVQENGRYLTDVLLHDIRMAGYSGCRSIDEVVPNIIANRPPIFASLTDGITVFENGAGWDNPTALTRVAGSDVITLQSAQGSGVSLRANMITDTATIRMIWNPDRLAANDLILISDCSHADLFRALAIKHGTIIVHNNIANTGNQLSKAYAKDAQLMPFDAHTYFIATGANAEPGLYQYSFNSDTATLLAEGVENMQLLLAEDTSGDQAPDVYVNATAVMDWAAVIGVRVGLLMRSANNVATEARAFTFNGANANTGNDTRVRKAFWSYAAMRNRIN
ncbi:MAG: PilW family protein, partial [Porticoccaceae bacterium]|nr:PilW family protein [Porticoccaceae bacterium]